MKRKAGAIGMARAAAVSAAAIAVLAAAAYAEERAESFEKRMPLEGARSVLVKNARGDVRIVGEAGRSEILCKYRQVVRGRRREEVDRIFAAMDVTFERKGGTIVIEAVYPKRGDGERGLISLITQQYANMGIDMEIELPAAAAVVVSTGSGDVALSKMHGSVEITTASGDVDVSAVGGSLEVQVASGEIVAVDIAGSAEVSTASGDVELRRVKGDAVARSASGDLVVSDIGGDLYVSSVSGDVEVENARSVEFNGTSGNATLDGVRGGVIVSTSTGDVFVTAMPADPANFEITTSSGEVTLVLEKVMAGGFGLKVQTTSGEIAVTLPIKLHKVARHYLSGVVGEGKSLVVIETSSGDISVIGPED